MRLKRIAFATRGRASKAIKFLDGMTNKTGESPYGGSLLGVMESREFRQRASGESY